MEISEKIDVCPDCFAVVRPQLEHCPDCGGDRKGREAFHRASLLAFAVLSIVSAWRFFIP